MSLGDRPQMRQPYHLRTVHCNVHIFFWKALRALVSVRKGEPFQFNQEVVSANLTLQPGAFLAVCTVQSSRRDLSAEVTLAQASLFGKFDMLEV
jgi:hypothetical protein